MPASPLQQPDPAGPAPPPRWNAGWETVPHTANGGARKFVASSRDGRDIALARAARGSVRRSRIPGRATRGVAATSAGETHAAQCERHELVVLAERERR